MLKHGSGRAFLLHLNLVYLSMKKILLLFGLVITIQSFAQKSQFKHEFKINAAYTVLGLPEIAYEYAVDSRISWGFNFGYATDKDDFNYTMYFQPYYRYYLGLKPNLGLFAEVNAGIYHRDNNIAPQKTVLGLGFGAGYKYYFRSGFMIETIVGLERSLLDIDGARDAFLFPGFGLNIGYRF